MHALSLGFFGKQPRSAVSNSPGLRPLDQMRTFPRKCPNCTVRCTHILTSTKVMYTHDFVNIFTDSRPVPGFLTMERCPIIWSPHQQHKHAHTRSSPRGHIPRKWSQQDFACAELQRILPHLRRRRSKESKIRSGQRGGTQRVATQPGAGSRRETPWGRRSFASWVREL